LPQATGTHHAASLASGLQATGQANFGGGACIIDSHGYLIIQQMLYHRLQRLDD